MRTSKEMPYHIGLHVKLYPSNEQKHIIAVNDGAQRSVYNHLVAAGNERFRLRQAAKYAPAYRDHLQYLQDTASSTAGMKTALPYLNEANVDSATVDNAFRNYRFAWKNMKDNHRGVPAFHKKSAEQSYQTNSHYKSGDTGIFDGSIRFDGMTDRRITTVTVQRDAVGEYWCSIAIASETPFRMQLPKTGTMAGIDLNILELVNQSDGVSFENRKFYKEAELHLAKEQHDLSRKQARALRENRSLLSSKNYQKQRTKVAFINRKIARRRDDYLNRVSRNLIENQDLIAAENLQVRNMLKNHKLAKAIQDCGWRKLLTLLQEKAATYGKECILVPPQYTTQTCSACGHKLTGDQMIPLSVRDWTCPACGKHHLRDTNAAQNILNKALEKRMTA